MRRSKADAEQTRISILDAAERLFCDQGIAPTTLERIARAAGVTRGAVYWHFKDKDELLTALRERYRLPQEDLIARAAEQGHDDPLGLLEATGCEVIALFEAEESQQHLFAILGGQPHRDECSAWLACANAEMFDLLRQLMEQARAQGALAADITPDDAALTLMVLMNGLFSEWLRSGKAFSLTEIGPRILHRQIACLRRPMTPQS